jgi:hypothetical protein
MRRLLRLVLHAILIGLAATIGFTVVDAAGTPGHGVTPPLMNGLIAGAVGLSLGLTVAWVRGVPWRAVPLLFRFWGRRFAQEFWWLTATSLAVVVLVYY